MAKARNVKSQSKFAGVPMTPLVGQDFLDFFGQGETSPRAGKTIASQGNVPKALEEFAPSFVPQEVQTGTGTAFEHPNEVATRNRGSNRKDNPVWKQAYDAALIQFNKGADARRTDEAKRKQQREGRREREDQAVGGGVGSPSGTTLITGAQGFLGGQGGAGSLLK